MNAWGVLFAALASRSMRRLSSSGSFRLVAATGQIRTSGSHKVLPAGSCVKLGPTPTTELNHLAVYVGGSDSTVIGVGPFRRIVMADDPTLTTDEVVVSFAHELKHYLLDTWKPVWVGAVLVVVGFGLVEVLGRPAIRRFGERFGFSELADPASFPLAVLILTAYWLAIGLPAFNAIQRHIEYYWFHRIWRANHPSQSERVRLANTYHPWTTGKPSVYRWLCQMP